MLLGVIFLCSFFSSKDLLIGKWRNEKYGVEVVIFKQGNRYFGNVTEAGNRKGNEKLKNGEVMQVLENFRKTSDSTYCCGSIYLPKAGISVASQILITNKDNLVITGSRIGIKSSSHWNRVQ